MTGQDMLKIHNALKVAIDEAGGGALRGMTLLEKLNELGIDVVIMDKPSEKTERPAQRLHLTSEEAA